MWYQITHRQKPLRPRLIEKKGSKTKLKLFEKNAFQADYDFEKQVNEFMAGVEVIEAKVEAFRDKYGIVRAVSVVYKEKGDNQHDI